MSKTLNLRAVARRKRRRKIGEVMLQRWMKKTISDFFGEVLPHGTAARGGVVNVTNPTRVGEASPERFVPTPGINPNSV